MESQITLKKQRNPFTQIPNELLCSDKISNSAKSLWCVLYSKPDNWVFYWPEILRNFKEGKSAMRNAKKELEKFGYLKTKQKRVPTGKGNEMKYGGMDMSLFYDPSLPLDQENQGSSESAENQHSRNETTGSENTQNQDIKKDELEENKNNLNKTQSEDLKAPLTPQEENGAFKFEGGVNKLVSLISGKALDIAKKNSKGWDIYFLMGVYIEGIDKRGFPKDINKAFPAWCLAYTKGNPPN